MNNQNLKDAVAAVIKANGNEEITGSILQSSLLAIINHFGSGSVFGGIAVPNTQPIDSDVNSFYFATKNGTYTNFGGYVIDKNQFTVFTNKSGSWEALPDLNVKSISKIEKTATVGFTDTYTITFSDGSTFDFNVTNGKTVEAWHAISYPADTLVFYGSGLYGANADTVAGDVPGVSSKWELKMYGFNLTESNDVLTFTAENGADLFHVDKEGYFWALYYPNSIPAESVTGLSDNLKIILKGIFYEVETKDIIQIQSPNNSFSIKQLSDGTIEIPKLSIGDLYYPNGQKVVKDEIFDGVYFSLPDPGLLKLDFSVLFPNEVGVKNRGVVRFVIGGVVMLTANCKVSVQGSGSVVFPKKGYTIDLFNNAWKKLQVKLGQFPALDSYHMKAYWTDATKAKDVFGGRIWQQLYKSRSFPNNLVRSYSGTITAKYDWTRYSPDAKFSLDGIPTDVYSSGSFKGQYVFRLKKDRLNYALDSANQNHLFLDSQVIGCALGEKKYLNYEAIAVDYEVRNPKSPNTTAKSNIYRFFTYMNDVFSGTKTFNGTYQDYLVLDSWIDWLILAELLGHWDSVNNNAMYVSYDGIHWQPCAIDMDFTLGVNQSGSMADPVTGWFMGGKDIFPKFRAQLLPEIKARYSVLRNSVLKMENLTNTFMSICANWSPNSYKTELEKWGTITQTTGVLGLDSIDNVINFMAFRLNWLDQQFG